MMGRGGRKVLLGLRWDGSSWDRVPAVLEALLPRLKDVPVLWCFPAPPSDGREWAKEPFIRALAGRLQSTTDSVFPTGYSGALHPLLAIDELEKELEWSAHNPWSTGITDLFGVKPNGLAPRLADFARKQAVELYRASGLTHICVENRAPRPQTLLYDGLTLIPYFPIDGPYGRPSRGLRRALRDGDFFAMLDLSTCTKADDLDALSEPVDQILPPRTRPVDFRAFAALRSPIPSKAVPSSCWDGTPAHRLRGSLALAGAFRKRKRKRNEEYRKVLNLLACRQNGENSIECSPNDQAESKRHQGKTLIAHMQGEVALAGKDFDVKLSGGRFSGIVRKGRFLLPDVPAASYMTINGKTYLFNTRSSISFEEDSGTGLRDELVAEGSDGGRLTIEYEFREDFPELFISSTVRYPLLGPEQTVNELVPLAISLQAVGKGVPAAVEAICPDGSRASHRIAECEGWKPVPAMAWSIEADGERFLLSSAPPDEKKWGLCFFRISKRKGRRRLEVSPFGSPFPAPASPLSGKTETLTLLIGLEKKP